MQHSINFDTCDSSDKYRLFRKCNVFEGKDHNIVDGDTIDVMDIRVRLVMVSAPELDLLEGTEAKKFVEDTCPVGSDVLVDEDDGLIEWGYDSIVGKVFCQGIILNEKVLEEGFGEIDTFDCAQSEFSEESWAKNYGC